MTASAELAKTAQRVMYVLCIEGVGWPVDEGSSYGGSADGFAGDLFVTYDFDGDLASKLDGALDTPVLHKGLRLPASIDDRMDPVSCEYSLGGMSFELDDVDSFIGQGILPHREEVNAELNAAVRHKTTTIELSFAQVNDVLAAGETAWLGGRELVKLGTRSVVAGLVYSYANCTRGHLGTPRGRLNPYLASLGALDWPAACIVQDVCKVLYDRRVRLYAVAPGITAANGACMLLYAGRIRSFQSDIWGVKYTFETAGERGAGYVKTRHAAMWLAEAREYLSLNGAPYWRGSLTATTGDYKEEPITGIQESEVELTNVWFHLEPQFDTGLSPAGQYAFNKVALGMFYHYRSEPGGTAGVYSAIAGAYPRLPQAADYGNHTDIIEAFMSVGGNIMRALKRRNADVAPLVTHDMNDILVSPANGLGEFYMTLQDGQIPCRFLLDNIKDEYNFSRFAVNRQVKRNPIDVLLIFLTSMNGEYERADATAGTASAITLGGLTGVTADMYAGYSLHCVEGANKGYSRVITTHTATVFTVSPAFPSAPAAGDEYQVRNSVYDVLPMSWGLCVPNAQIDIAQFELVRDTYLPDAQLGKFIIGEQDSMDIFDLLQKNLCAAYGLMLYLDRTSGKLSIRYVGDAFEDEVLETYPAVDESDVLQIGDIDYGAIKPVGKVTLKVRSAEQAVVNYQRTDPGKYGTISKQYWNTQDQSQRIQSPSLEGEGSVLVIRPVELDALFDESDMAEISVDAMLNSVDDVQFVITEALGRLRRYVTPPPVLTIKLSTEWIEQLQPGSFFTFTHSKIWDPYLASRGVDSRVCRVIGTRISFEESSPGIEVQVEMLEALAGAKVAPSIVSAGTSGADGFGTYVNLVPATYDEETGEKNYHFFAVGDLIQLRDITGATRGSLGAITGFGTNFSSDPTTATESGGNIRIYISGAVPGGHTALDYVTFDDWSGSTTARMRNYACYAGDTGTLSDGTNPRRWST